MAPKPTVKPASRPVRRPSMLQALRRRLLDPGLAADDILSLTDAILALQRASLAR